MAASAASSLSAAFGATTASSAINIPPASAIPPVPANATNGTMSAVVWNGQPYNMSVEQRPIPTIVNATDAIIRVSTAAICGSDLHVYHGLYGSEEPGWIMGHEAVGYVDSIGSGVNAHAIGDYVIIPDNFGTGQTPEIQPSTPETPGYGPDYTNGQDVGGAQAEYVRVPYADQTLIPIPQVNGTWNTSLELDYVMVSDIFATGWEAVTWSGFEPGDTIAIFGAGPVGLMSAYSAYLRGASRIYVVDRYAQRLNLAAGIDSSVVPINYNASDPVIQIMNAEAEYGNMGVRRSVDAVGFEAETANGTISEALVFNQCLEVLGVQGGFGVVGIYDVRGNATGRPRAATLPQDIPFNASMAFNKGIQMHTGAVDDRMLAPELVSLITAGIATPSFIVDAQINITQAPDFYRAFSDRDVTKIVIRF
jgi:threonine dehydrogenase-like Zn-dependent dehydrogenase